MPKLRPLPAVPSQLRVQARGAIGVDRKAKAILGYVVAQKGHFKKPGRGQFDDASLAEIVRLGNADNKGLRSRWTHPTLSADGLGKHLGRSKHYRVDGDRVRGDLYLSETAFEGNPNGNLGDYLLDLAEEDPDALSSSLVLDLDQERVLDKKGRPVLGEDGEPLPPIWRPTKLIASDIVDTGDAVDGLLSVDTLPDSLVRRATEFLNQQFGADVSREVLESRVYAWFDRYLGMRFGEVQEPADTGTDMLRRKLAMKAREFA